MISKNILKFINSLQIKKYRRQHNAFLVEGGKSVCELLKSDIGIQQVFATPDFVQKNEKLFNKPSFQLHVISEEELAKAGTFQTNDAALAIANTSPNNPIYVEENEYVLMLDDIRDPGNLGTIIRIADWYGIRKLICSEHTADLYNPKTISATMGSFTRVGVYYCDLAEYLSEYKEVPVYGAFLDGDDVHTASFADKGIILMGNEAHGISDSLKGFVPHKITIPAYGKAESLNVAIATAVICDNLRRNKG